MIDDPTLKTPDDDPAASTQPVKKPLQAVNAPGVPLPASPAAPLSAPSSGMLQAQNASPDPFAFAGRSIPDDGADNAPMAPSPTTQPVYTGPKAQDEMPNSPYTQTQNPNDFNVWDDISGTYKNAQGQTYSGVSANPYDKTTIDKFNNDQNLATWGQYATGLNSQPGYAGSGMPYLDPNKMPDWFTGGAPAPAVGGSSPTVANPLSPSQKMPALGPITSSGTQDKPIDQGGTVTPTALGLKPPTGPASDVGAGSPVNPPSAPAPGSGPGAATPGAGAGVSLTPINPDDSLISKTIAPGPGVDRVKTFQDALNSTISNVIDPAYAASTRDLNRYNFGRGRGVSGEARTSQGDLADRREQRIADLSAQGLAGATTGSIDDLYKNLGIAQQQQGFQKNLSDTAFNQSLQQTELEDALTNSAFGRASAQSAAGEANSPANIALILSQIFGNQSSEAGKAAAQLFGAMGAKNGAGGSNGLDINAIIKYIQSIGGGGGGTDGGGGYVDTPANDGTAVA